jgi:hypothetical protein
VLTRDELLDNVMMYWLPAAAASSARMYWENFSSCKFFGDGTGQSMKTHARVDFPRIRQANTPEVS